MITQDLPPLPAVSDLRSPVSLIRNTWLNGESPDAEAALALHPALAADPAAVLELAFEEYCLRTEAGETLDAVEFCERFPGVRAALRRRLQLWLLVEDRAAEEKAAAEDLWPRPGATFLGCTVLGELGRGTFARVYLAAQPDLGNRPVVLKVADYRGRQEAHTLGPLSHANVVPVHWVERDPVSLRTVVCMPYLGAATLHDVLRRAFAGAAPPASARIILEAAQTPPPGVAVPPAVPDLAPPAALYRRGGYRDGVRHLGIELAEALAFLHARGVCHRDLKPSNVLVGPDGRPRLLDFNLAVDHRASRLVGGTPRYMPPEQVRMLLAPDGGLPPPDPRADLFALGVILYELLSGRHPFDPLPADLPPEEMCAWLLERQPSGPVPLRLVSPGVDRGTACVVERCLACDPAARPRGAAELARALRRARAPLRRAWHHLADRTWLARAAAVGLLAAAVAAAPAALGHREPEGLRQVHAAWEAYQQQHYAEAVAHGDRALAADPDFAAVAYYARGRARLRLAEVAEGLAQRELFTEAAMDFSQAARRQTDGRIEASWAYCLNRLDQPNGAANRYENAIAAGYAPPEVYANLAYSYTQQHRSGEAKPVRGEELVRQALDKALAGNPDLQAALQTRILLNLLPAKKDPLLRPALLADVERAVAHGSVSADLHRDAACAYSLAAREDARCREQGVAHARQAVELGTDPIKLGLDPLLANLRNSADFQELLRRPSPPQPAPPAVRVLDPVPDGAE